MNEALSGRPSRIVLAMSDLAVRDFVAAEAREFARRLLYQLRAVPDVAYGGVSRLRAQQRDRDPTELAALCRCKGPANLAVGPPA